MFKNLRLKLTLINISVVGIILLLFFTGVYIFMKKAVNTQSEQLMYAVISDKRPPVLNRFPLQQRHWANLFYARVDDSGNIIFVSPNLPVTEDELGQLIQNAQQAADDKGFEKVKLETFRYLKAYRSFNHEWTIVFLSTQPENETLGRLKAILFFIGLTGLIVVFVCSLFLADRALIPIRKSWDRQKNFVADASHELRSPLAVIQTNLELVLGNTDESVESQSKWLENIQTENKRMTKLVNDLLFLARADSNQQMMEKRFFELHRTIREVINIFEPIAARKKIKLEFETDSEIDFWGDEARIKQLAVILIDNAIKYTPSGGQVKLQLKSDDGHTEIIVSDTGEGIAQEHIGRIFERFYRVDKARSRESGGTGLGLSIADWIVKEHRGIINVASIPGKGTSFKVILPKVLPKAR